MTTSAGEPSMRKAWATVAVSALAAFQVAMTLSIVFVVFVDLEEYFPDASNAQLSWAINAFTIVGASTVVLGAAIADRYGHKRIALVGTALFAFGSIVAGTAPEVPILIAGRSIQAFGASLFGPASLALILVALPISRRGIGLGVFTMGGAFAAAAGPSIGGVIVDNFGWRWAFLVVVPVGLIAVAIGARVFVESEDLLTERLPDPFGALLIMTGIGSLILALVQSPQWGWGSGRTIGAIVVGLTLICWLLIRSSRHPKPILDLTLYRVRSFRAGNISFALFALSFFATLFASVLFLTEIWGYSISRAGLLTMPFFLATGVTGPLAGRAVDRFSPRPIVMLGATQWTVAVALLAVLVGDEPAVGMWIPLVILAGIGSGMFWGSAPTLAVEGLEAHRFARATGVNQTLQNIGSSLAIALAIALLGEEPTLDDFDAVFLIIVIAGALTTVAAWTAKPAKLSTN